MFGGGGGGGGGGQKKKIGQKTPKKFKKITQKRKNGDKLCRLHSKTEMVRNLIIFAQTYGPMDAFLGGGWVGVGGWGLGVGGGGGGGGGGGADFLKVIFFGGTQIFVGKFCSNKIGQNTHKTFQKLPKKGKNGDKLCLE